MTCRLNTEHTMPRKFKDSQIVVWTKMHEKGIIFGFHKGRYVVAFKDAALAKDKPGGRVEGTWSVVGLKARELELYRGIL